MFNKIEEWLFNQFAGKLVARAAATVAGFVASAAVQAYLAKAGVHGVAVDPTELTAGFIAAAHAAYEWYKAWRAKSNPVAAVPLPNSAEPAK